MVKIELVGHLHNKQAMTGDLSNSEVHEIRCNTSMTCTENPQMINTSITVGIENVCSGNEFTVHVTPIQHTSINISLHTTAEVCLTSPRVQTGTTKAKMNIKSTIKHSSALTVTSSNVKYEAGTHFNKNFHNAQLQTVLNTRIESAVGHPLGSNSVVIPKIESDENLTNFPKDQIQQLMRKRCKNCSRINTSTPKSQGVFNQNKKLSKTCTPNTKKEKYCGKSRKIEKLSKEQRQYIIKQLNEIFSEGMK